MDKEMNRIRVFE